MKNYCNECKEFVDFTTEERKETYPVKGYDIEINAKVCICKECGQIIWDDDCDNDNLKKAFDEYRKLFNLLTADEIKAIRDKYDTTQTIFAKILGLGEKTITRYENGSLQDEAQNNLILLQKNVSNFKILWEKKKHILSEAENEKISNAIKKAFEQNVIPYPILDIKVIYDWNYKIELQTKEGGCTLNASNSY